MTNAPPRMFLSEFAVNLYSARWIIITPAELMSGGTVAPHAAELARCCHIYLICRRPAAAYDPTSFAFDGSTARGRLTYKISGESYGADFAFPFRLIDGAVGARISRYPHRNLETFLPNGESVRRVPASMVAISMPDIEAFRQLDVLYVGQAYAEGRRSSLDRLKSHATLQKILADVHHNIPDDEILILTFEYLPYRVISSMDGIDKSGIRDARNSGRFKSIHANPLSEHQQICLVEAGLIRYFKPTYNQIYKESFPAADQKILTTCYKLDFSALVVEIDTEELRMKLFSKAVAPAEHHIAKFDLNDPQLRRSFFTFVARDGQRIDFPDVIPPTR
jgi:hypothetical protein